MILKLISDWSPTDLSLKTQEEELSHQAGHWSASWPHEYLQQVLSLVALVTATAQASTKHSLMMPMSDLSPLLPSSHSGQTLSWSQSENSQVISSWHLYNIEYTSLIHSPNRYSK